MQVIPEIKLSTSRFAAHWGHIRALSEAGETPKTPGLAAAFLELRSLDRSLPEKIKTRSGSVIEGRERAAPLYWRTLDALVYGSSSADDLQAIPEVMPRIGGELDATTAMASIGRALKDSQAEFDGGYWAQAETTANARIDEFRLTPAEKREAAVRFILSTAGIVNSPKAVNLLIVPKMAGKEGMTVRTPGGLLVVIGAEKYAGADFVEVVLHESTHVFDATAGEDSLFGKLRKALKDAKRPDIEVEQVPHIAMFLLAAEAVRRNIDPKHRDVGETFGAYSRGLERFRVVVEPELRKLMDGKYTVDEAVSAILAHIAKQPVIA